ncbi:MAG: anti-sigma factor antagonist [bacterium]
MLRATSRREHDITIISLHGDVTEETGRMLPALRETIDGGHKQVILNLTDVKYVNSAGLSTFVESYKWALRQDAKVALCDLQPTVLKIFKLARVEIFIPIYNTEALAFQHFGVMVKATEGPPREQILILEPGLELGDEIQRLLTSQKEQVNYRISRVPSVDEGLRFMSLRPTQVVILDVRVNVKDAEHFIGTVRTNPVTRNAAIIVATPENHVVDADWLIRNGADDLIRMPLSPYEVSSRLRMAFALNYALLKDEGQLAQLNTVKLQNTKWAGSNYPTLL